MNRFITTNDLHHLRSLLSKIKDNTIDRFRYRTDIAKIKQYSQLRGQSNDFSDDGFGDHLSYQYRLFDFTQQKKFSNFVSYTDENVGGTSEGRLLFDRQDRNLIIQGTINIKNKDKMVNYPSIGLARASDYPIRCGPFNAISVQLKSDGMPIHLGVEVQTVFQGLVSAYGVISSKETTWQTYELPIMNMILVGSEANPKSSTNYINISQNPTSIFEKDTFDMRRLFLAQSEKQITIRDLNIRLLNIVKCERNVAIRNINLVRRAQFNKFTQEYTMPYFFKVKTEEIKYVDKLKLSWLSESYDKFQIIDLGDRRYIRKKVKKNG